MLKRKLFSFLEERLVRFPCYEELVSAFSYAYNSSAGYRAFLSSCGFSMDEIVAHKNFSSLPILKKHDVFPDFSKWVSKAKGNFVFMPSSGASGNFSFGVYDAKEMKKSVDFVDFLLDKHFFVRDKKTLLLNVLPMGIHIESRACSVIATGVRIDSAVRMLRMAGRLFEQAIIVGDALFVKLLLEEVPLKEVSVDVSLILGGEFLAEGLREYFIERIGVNSVFSSFGTAELGLNLMHETPLSVFIRKTMKDNRGFFKAFSIDAAGYDFLPTVFQFYPGVYFLESIENQLIATPMVPDRPLPLVRYATGDVAKVVDNAVVMDALKDFGIECGGLENNMPFVFLWGRDEILSIKGKAVSIAKIREALFNNTGLAGVTTGRFFVDVVEGSHINLSIQLRKGGRIEDGVVSCAVSEICNADIRVVSYEFDAYPYEVDFERKSVNIGRKV